jgi:hypothetical protein
MPPGRPARPALKMAAALENPWKNAIVEIIAEMC